MAEANKERRQHVIRLLEKYDGPVRVNEFVHNHIQDLNIRNDYKGRNILSAFLYNMARRGEILKLKKEGTPYISLKGRAKIEEFQTVESDGHSRSTGQPTLTSRQDTVVQILNQYSRPIRLSEFVKRHRAELGYSDDPRGRNAANVYLYEMIDRGLIVKKKIGRHAFIETTEAPLPRPRVKKTQPREVATIPTAKHSLSVLLETKSALDIEDYELDLSIEKLVSRKMQIRKEMSALSAKLNTLFQV